LAVADGDGIDGERKAVTERDDRPFETSWRSITPAQAWRRFSQSENRGLVLRNVFFHVLRVLYNRARWVAGILLRQLREVRLQVTMAGAVVIGRLRDPHQVLEHWTSPDRPLGQRVVLFVHFDAAGRVIPTTRSFITSLADAGLSVAFVTNSEKIEPEAKEFLKGVCGEILIRRNIGYDFGAWRDALDTLALPRPETEAILLVNDSVYGPFGDFAGMLGGLDFERAEIWGLTESWQHRYHLQSFFLACGEASIRSDAWQRFWRSVRPVPSKEWIIRHCEIGFTRALQKGGVNCAALFPQSALLDAREIARLEALVATNPPRNSKAGARALHARRLLRSIQRGRQDLNPSIDLWRQLLWAGYPFVKRELLRKNPSRIADVFDWEQVVTETKMSDPRALADELRVALGPKLQSVWNVPEGENEDVGLIEKVPSAHS
jgi:Rhamnan synthesis protein F